MATLEISLQETFGARRRMFDADPSAISGTKVGVTATTISDARTFLFSNYNGSAIRQSGCGKPYRIRGWLSVKVDDLGYKLIRPDNTDDEPLLWEA